MFINRCLSKHVSDGVLFHVRPFAADVRAVILPSREDLIRAQSSHGEHFIVPTTHSVSYSFPPQNESIDLVNGPCGAQNPMTIPNVMIQLAQIDLTLVEFYLFFTY